MNEEMKKIILEKLWILFKDFLDLEKKAESESIDFDVIATSEVIDRYGDVVKADGVDSKNWFKNPVILANHNYTIENIVWKWIELYEDKKGRLRLKWVFTQATEMWKIATELYKTWFLKAVSIWFITKLRDDKDRDIIEKWELLEVSFVAVPANPEALSLDKKTYKRAVEMWMIREKEEEQISESKVKEIVLWFRKEFLNEIKELIKKDLKEEIKTEIIKELNLSDDKDDEPNEKAQDEILKNFFQNLAKNVSNSLHQMKK
jgi:hypothetical protein